MFSGIRLNWRLKLKLSLMDPNNSFRFEGKGIMYGLMALIADEHDELVYDNSTLKNAINSGNVRLVNEILAGGASLDPYSPGNDQLMFDAINVSHEMATVLYHAGADCLEQGENGDYPIYTLIVKGYNDLVELALIEKKIDVNGLTSDDGLTLLSAAVIHGNIEAVNMLIRLGAKLNDALFQVRKVTIFQRLVEHFGIESFNVMMYDEYPIHYHCRYNDGTNNIVEEMLRLGANPNVRDPQSGETCLHYAVRTDDDKLTQLLLNYGADPNTADFDGLTPFIMAKEDGSEEVYRVIEDYLNEDIKEPEV